jgi:hypothetical protein
MINHNPKRRPAAVAATIAASFLMLVFGLSYHILVAQLRASLNETPIDPAVVKRFPLQIGSWIGQDIPLDEAIVQKTGTDAHINRRYLRGNGLESVSLYMACGVHAGHLMGHRPEVCYIGAGLSLVDRCSMELPLNDGTTLPCSILRFVRGGLDTANVTVLNYFIVDGELCGDVSLLKSRAWRDFRAVGYVIQVQIVATTETLTDDSGTRLVSAFAVDSGPSIAGLFEHIEKGPSSGGNP